MTREVIARVAGIPLQDTVVGHENAPLRAHDRDFKFEMLP